MVLPVTGEITAAMVNVELGRASTATLSLNDPDVRDIAGKPTGAIGFSDLRGKSGFDDPGSITFTANGTFTVPKYRTSLVIEMWGGGGGGSADQFGGAGGNGGTSTFTTLPLSSLTAGGGKGGRNSSGGTPGGSGGIASGGDINTAGGDAPTGTIFGGNAPNGGSGGNSSNGYNAQTPGGGGSGSATNSAGAGAGSYLKKTYSRGLVTAGTTPTVTVGDRGSKGEGGTIQGRVGARGEVRISWT